MSRKQPDLEALRSLLGDRKTHHSLAIVTKVEVLQDRSRCRVQVKSLPEENELVAIMGWSATGPNAGSFSLPVVDDLVLLAYVSPDEVYVISRLTSKADMIPTRALNGSTVVAALSGKDLHLTSDKKLYLGRAGSSDPTEPTVLGNVMKTGLGELLDKLSTLIDKLVAGPIAVDSMGGSAVTHPTLITALNLVKTDITTLKNTYVTTASSNIVSQHSFVER